MKFLQKIQNHKPQPKYETPEAKLTKQLKHANRARLGYKTLSVLLLTGLVALGFLYRNLQVTTELNLLKQRIETEKAMRATESNATATSTPDMIQTSSDIKTAPKAVKTSISLK